MTAAAEVETARAYYDSADADHFYATVWGGEDIHIGLYETDDEVIADASRRTVVYLASLCDPRLKLGARLLDMGSGYCGAARYIAGEFNVSVTALNLSGVENERARALNARAGLAERIDVQDGSIEDLPYADESYDVVWSQDAILHTSRRERVIAEGFRVLKPGGVFVFTDPMQSDGCPDGVLNPILERIHLSSLGSPGFYLDAARRCGFADAHFNDMTPQLIRHYTRVLEETEKQATVLEKTVSREYLQRMKAGLKRWIEGGHAGHLAWGAFRLAKE